MLGSWIRRGSLKWSGSEGKWWACLDSNQGPLPYQLATRVCTSCLSSSAGSENRLIYGQNASPLHPPLSSECIMFIPVAVRLQYIYGVP